MRTLAEIHRLAREKAMESLFVEAEQLVLYGYRLAMEDYGANEGVNLPAVVEENTNINVPTFMQFWDAYDKKRAKPECEKLWNNLSSSDKVAAYEYIPLYIQSQPDKQFRQDPSRYLRRHTWNDEIINSNNNTKGNATAKERNYIAEQSDFLAQLNAKRGSNKG